MRVFFRKANKVWSAAYLLIFLLMMQASLLFPATRSVANTLAPHPPSSYVLLTGISKDTPPPTSDVARYRNQFGGNLLPFALVRTLAQHLPESIFAFSALPAFYQWNDRIGAELAASPHADMVARK